MLVLRTPRVVLRWFTDDDARFIVELLNDPGWKKFIGERGVRTEDDARTWIAERLVALYRSQGFGLWAMQRVSDGALIGMCGLVKRDSLPGIDIGYALLPAFRGMGYVREAAAACLAYGADVLGLERILAITRPGNTASIRVLESLGMQWERTERLADADYESMVFAWQAGASAMRRGKIAVEYSSQAHTVVQAKMQQSQHEQDFNSDEVRRLRADLALALRAAASHGLAEGVCNHFSVELPDHSGRFLLNPRGLMWSEVGPDDIVMIDGQGDKLAGRHAVEPTAMFIHAAIHRLCGQACVLHTHMPYATALTLTADRALDTTLSQNAMRFHGRVAVDAHYNGLALDASEGQRIARAMKGRDVGFLGNHGVVVCGTRMDHAYDDLYFLERACMHQVLAQSTGRPLVPVDAVLAQRVCEQALSERLQSELFFEALRRTL